MTRDTGHLGSQLRFGVGDDVVPPEREPILPLRVLALADLIPRDEHNAGASAPEAALRVDPSRFDDLFAKLRPRIAVDVPSVLAEGRTVRVDLAPTSLKSFRPDGLCGDLALLRSLLDGRLVLDRLRDGTVTPEQARSELERLWGGSPFAHEVLGLLPAPAPAPATPPGTQATASEAPVARNAGGGLDALLDMVDVSGPAPSTPAVPSCGGGSGKVADLIASVVRGARRGVQRAPTEAIAHVERALGAQIGAILQHPEVRRIERAWRGLKLLVDRAQGHGGVRVDVVSARPEEVPAALARAARARAEVEPPVSFAVADVDIDGSARALSLFAQIADRAEELAIPVLLNAAPGLFGREDLGGLDRLDDKAGLLAAPERAPWRARAATPSARWIALAANGVLARLGYDKGSSRVREAVVRELPEGEAACVFVSAAWVVGALAVGSFRDTGWPCRIVGSKHGGAFENLPVREIPGGYEGEEGVAIPTEVFLSTESQRALSSIGVLALASAPNSDVAVIQTAATAYVPDPSRPGERFERVSLVDQLFVARLAQFLRALCAKLPASSSPVEVEPVVRAAVWTLFEDAPPSGPEISVRAKQGGGDASVELTVRPRRFLGVGLEEITLEVPLG